MENDVLNIEQEAETLTFEEIVERIETDGFCRIPQVYTPEQVQATLDLAQDWYEKTKDTLADDRPALAREDPFLWNPQNKDIRFLEMLFRPPIIEEVLKHFLNDPWFKQIPQDEPNYILRNLLVRSSHKRLPMHIDSLLPYAGEHVFVMQASIILEDQSEANGCTVVVPGSHTSGGYVDQSAFDIAIPLETRAGDVVIWDSRIWHGAGENKTDGTRWAMIGTFTRWWLKQMFNITDNMPQEIYEQLTDSQKAVMGFCSIPHNNEQEGIDMKRGYDSLLTDVSGYRCQEMLPWKGRVA